MARDVAAMFDELKALADRHAELHVDGRGSKPSWSAHARTQIGSMPTIAELERVRDELDRARQDAGLWREEADRERARIANMQTDAEHTEREMARLRAELERARRPWWRRFSKE